MSSINGIAQDPMAKIAVILKDHDDQLKDHERRITDIETEKRSENQAFRHFTWAMYLQIAVFIVNLLLTLLRGGGK